MLIKYYNSQYAGSKADYEDPYPKIRENLCDTHAEGPFVNLVRLDHLSFTAAAASTAVPGQVYWDLL